MVENVVFSNIVHRYCVQNTACDQGCGVGVYGVKAEVGVIFFKIPESQSESCQKRGLRIGHTCFHNLTEYNKKKILWSALLHRATIIMDSA